MKSESKFNKQDDLTSLSMSELKEKLASSEEGLSQTEAKRRLIQYGTNEIKEEKNNLFLKFLAYFWGPIPWMIEVAVILSAIIQHWPDFFIIIILLISNAAVGFWEEYQAGNAIAALKARLAIQCRVKRDGKWINPPVSELVPGDVIRLRLGDIVPADARLLEGDPIEVDQSALTGESLPIARKSGDVVYDLDHPHLQTLMYMKLSIAGHMTIFLTRTRGPFWSTRPALILLIAVIGTQTIATLIAVYGFFMMPIGWSLALFVWGYALVLGFVSDGMKLLAYRFFEFTQTKINN